MENASRSLRCSDAQTFPKRKFPRPHWGVRYGSASSGEDISCGCPLWIPRGNRIDTVCVYMSMCKCDCGCVHALAPGTNRKFRTEGSLVTRLQIELSLCLSWYKGRKTLLLQQETK